MTVKELTRKIKCDMPNCRNMAFIKIEKNGFFRGMGIFLCKECMEELYAELGKKITPKSPSNMLNKKIKLKKDE
jgi:hypothetical protein